jgi:small GTP-binding protein
MKEKIMSFLTKKKKKEIKGLILGLDNAGKTTILKSFKGETKLNLAPTKGFNYQKFDYNNTTFILWDLGGQKTIRKFWEDYYQKENDGIIYVIDSSDSERLEETGKELYNILQQPELSGVPLLIYANKQDLNMALSADEIMEQLGLEDIDDRNWTIIACSALTKQGLSTGLHWLIECCSND